MPPELVVVVVPVVIAIVAAVVKRCRIVRSIMDIVPRLQEGVAKLGNRQIGKARMPSS